VQEGSCRGHCFDFRQTGQQEIPAGFVIQP
jgi:hypothetical protein